MVIRRELDELEAETNASYLAIVARNPGIEPEEAMTQAAALLPNYVRVRRVTPRDDAMMFELRYWQEGDVSPG